MLPTNHLMLQTLQQMQQPHCQPTLYGPLGQLTPQVFAQDALLRAAHLLAIRQSQAQLLLAQNQLLWMANTQVASLVPTSVAGVSPIKAEVPCVQEESKVKAKPLTQVPPCAHNMWSVRRWLEEHMCVKLRCHVCSATWRTALSAHSKCSEFYSGSCVGACTRTHIFARGVLPENIVLNENGEVISYSLKSLRTLKPKNRKKPDTDDPSTCSDSSDDE